MRQIASRITALLFGCLLLVAVTLSTAWNLGKTQADWGLPKLVPDDPDITLSLAINEFRKTRRAPVGSEQAQVAAASSLDPLEEEPLLLASLANTRGDHDKAIRLLIEARRRNPAASEVRVLLLDRFLRMGDIAGGIGEIGSLAVLLPGDKRKGLMDLLLGLVAAPETRHEAIAALRQSPMRKPLIGELAKAGASSYLLLDLSQGLGSLSPGSDEARWSQTVTQTLVQHGDLDGAHRLWQFYSPAAPAKAGIFDPTFKSAAAPPFGWQLSEQPGGYSEVEREGLRARYDGRNPALFARQLLMLAPGRYRLDYELAKSEGRPPNLAWRIDCLSSGRTVLDLPFQQNYSFEQDQSPEFTIPVEECPGQWVALVGRPMPGPSMSTALIKTVQVSRLGDE